MSRPGVDILLSDTPGTVSLPTDTGVAFITGETDRGPLGVKLILSLAQFVAVYGDRQAYSPLYDWVDLFFREGGYALYMSRVVGPTPTTGTLALNDDAGSPAVSLHVNAIGPGAWSANYKVAVVDGTVTDTYQIQIEDTDGNILENSPNLTTQNDAIIWAETSQYVRITLGVSALIPVAVAATALSAGTDDRSNITDTQWLAAQNLFTTDYGPGQVVQPGRTSSTAYSQLADHAEANTRVAVLDGTDTATAATLEAAAGAVGSRMAAYFAPWVVVPGLVASAQRTVPPSALVCGLCARNDSSLGPNRPSAGSAGISRYAIGVSQAAWDDDTREALNDAGVNVIRNWPINGGVRVYGWRTTTNPTSDSNWIGFGNARLYMAISAVLRSVGENFEFDEIDGQNGSTVNGFHDALAGVLLTFYNSGQLFGDSSDEAFSVDTGPSVNTLESIALNQLAAICYVKMSPMAEYVPITIVKRSVTDVLVAA